MATEKLRAELELITRNAEKDLARFDRSLAGVEKRIKSIGGRGGKSLKPLGDGLSAATANASEFEKSMAAANARVIAFGASAGLIFQVSRALKETVKATIEVEKSLTDINVVLNTNSANLQKFGSQLFKIAGQTGQSFKVIAAGATELARQGLGTEKTLKRLNDAMILSRLTGMGAEEAVSSLTAAVNSFNKAGITSAQVVNKMAKVDQAFAVSSDDLAKAISRVGSSAVDAGVSMDELLAITTAVQQRTARGGAVIGNAFKTIFTRIGRTDVQKKLRAINVETRDLTTGAMLPATKVLQNLSKEFQRLGQSQQNQIAESVAGVFQVNILRAALGDLSSKYGVYNRALRESASATDEAYRKNEQLNQTLGAMVNKTLANLTKAGAGIGGATLEPAIRNVLGAVNDAIASFGEGGKLENFGKGLGKDILKGIGDFISGPGLAIVTYGIGRLLVNFGGFAKQALGGILELNKNVALRKNIEASVTAELSRQPAIIKQIQSGELSAAAAAKDMLAAMKASNVEATKLAVTSRAIASSMMGVPGGMRGMRGAGRADGFVPNFANPNAERAAAAAGGYKAGGIRTMSIPGQGAVMYNSAETVKQFPGMKQPAIMPPQGSLAGSNYQKAFGAAHGFDPYAAGGFVPNFALMTMLKSGRASAKIGDVEKGQQVDVSNPQIQSLVNTGFIADPRKRKKTKRKLKPLVFDAKQRLGILGLDGLSGDKISTSTAAGNISQFKKAGLTERQLQTPIRFENISVRNLDTIKGTKGGKFKQEFSDEVSKQMLKPVSKMSKFIYGKALGNDFNVSVKKLEDKFFGKQTQLLPTSAEGQIFEAAINLGLLTNRENNKATFDQSIESSTKPFDFEEVGTAKPPFKEIFNFKDDLLYADAKRTADTNQVRTLIKKAYNRGVPGLPQPSQIAGGKAAGLIPNFSPLGDAVTRERAAGVPASAIRVGSSPALKSSGNPGGLGVYNTIHEPAGLGQGISRSRRMGINPKSHGIPNFSYEYLPGGMSVPTGTSFPAAGGFGAYPKDRGPAGAPGAHSALPPSYFDSFKKEAAEVKAAKDLKDSGKDNLKASERFQKGAEKFNAGLNSFMMFGSMVGYMGAPALNRQLGFEQDDQRIQNALMYSFLGHAAGGALGGLAGRLPGGLSMLGQGMQNRGGAMASGTGGRAMLGRFMSSTGGRLASLAARGTGPGMVISSMLPLLAAGGAGYAGFQSGAPDPEEQAFRGKVAAAQAKGIKAQDALNAAEAFQTGMTTLVSTFDSLTGKQRAAQFEAVSKSYDKFTSQLTQEDAKEIDSAYNNLRQSMVEGRGIDDAAEKLIETLGKVGDSMAELKRQAEGTTAGLELEAEFKKLRTGGVDRMAIPETKRVPIYSNMALANQVAEGGGPFGQEVLRKGAESLNYFGEFLDPVAEFFGVDPAKKVDPTRFQTPIGFKEVPTGKMIPGGAEVISDEGKKMAAKAAGSLISAYLSKAKDVLNLRASDILKSGEAKDMMEASTIALERARAGGLAGLIGITGGSGETRAMMGPNVHPLVRSQIASDFYGRMSPTGIALHGQTGTVGGPVGADRTGMLFDSLQAERTARINLRRRELNVGFENQIAAAEEATRKSARGQNVRLAQRMFGEEAGLEAQRKADIGQADADRDESIRKSNAALQKAFADMGDNFSLSMEKFIQSKDFSKMIAPDITNAAAREGITNQFKELRDLLALVRGGKGGTEAAGNVQQRIASLMAEINETGGTPDTIAALKALKEGFEKLDSSIIDNALKTDNATSAHTKITGEINKAAKATKEFTREVKLFYTGGMQKARQESVRVAESRVSALAGLPGATGAEKGQAAMDLRRSRIAAGGGFQGLGGIRDAFSYNANDAALEFDAAMVDFGNTIKDSTKGAIKDIISGAESFEGAMYNVFATLADKIANQGINQGVDSIFGSLFGRRHGGKIPGYNQGGVVSGGSGVRDDVLTMMQGGEYVIKKSSAQKIGYGTLNAINGYANGGKARVSLAKEFLFTGDDPRRPTGGRYNVSRNLSTAAIFREDDPQTSRMFGRQETMVNYQEYRRAEQARRDKILDGIKRQKRARLMNAYISAGLRIGAGFLPNTGGSGTAGAAGSTEPTVGSSKYITPLPGPAAPGPGQFGYSEYQGARGGSPALLMGGEYVMSPRTTAKYGTGFMGELNRGKVPGFAQGGMVGGGGGAVASGLTTNNVNLSINIDKSGDTQVETQESSSIGQDKESQEVENSKKFADAIRAAVQKEITHQQRPGGLLRDGASYAGGRRI